MGCGGDDAYNVHVRSQNRAIWAQCTFAWLSIVACTAVLVVSYAHGKDRRSLRARIVFGLFLANLLFSTGLAVPAGVMFCEDTGEWAERSTSKGWIINAQLYAGAAIYAGKYWTVMYETFIVAASVASLRSGSINIPRKAEIAGHTLCFVVFATVFGVYIATTLPLQTYQYHHGFGSGFDNLWTKQEAFIRRLLDGWIGLFVVFVLAWLCQRLHLRQLLREWREARTDARQDWKRDLWNTSNPAVQEERDRKKQLLTLQRESYLELAKPLEPYVGVFVAFSIPAIVLSTRWCDEQSNRIWDRGSGPAITCWNTCILILSLRSLATAAVYFSDPQCRAELLDVGTLGRKFWGRLCGFCAWAVGHESGGRGLRFDRDNLEQVRVIDDRGSDEVADTVMDPRAGPSDGPGESTVRYELMEE